MKAVILLAGPLFATPAARNAVEGARWVIAADGGIRHAKTLGLDVGLWVGDFDSSTPQDLADFSGVPRRTYPRAKDATDAELATQAALACGANELLLLGGLGGELDHTLAHLTLSLKLAEAGVSASVTDGLRWAWPLVPPGRELALEADTPFSIVPMTDLEGLTIAGARWEASSLSLGLGSTRTLRNVALGPLRLGLSRGRAVVFADRSPRAAEAP